MSNSTVNVTYNPDSITTDLSLLRLVIGDSDSKAGIRPNGANFSDAELIGIITAVGAWPKAIPVLLRTLAAEYAAASEKAFGLKNEDDGKRYAAAASEFRLQAVSWDKESALLADNPLSGSSSADAFAIGYYADRPYFELPPRDLR